MQKFNNSRSVKKISFSQIVAVVLAVCFVLVCITGAVAKYIKSTGKNDYAVADEFYFTSDVLDGRTHTVSASTDGSASLYFTLMNHDDDLRYSATDINYTVSVVDLSDNSAVSLDSSCKNVSGTISKGAVNNVSVTVAGLKAGKSYSVSATTSNSYSKTLKATFKVTEIDNNIYSSVRDENEYIELMIWTNDFSGDIELSYPDSLVPDNTDSLMNDWQVGAQTYSFSLSSHSSLNLRFFKNDPTIKFNSTVSGKKVIVNAQ